MIEIRKISGSHEMQDSALITVDRTDGRSLSKETLRKYFISEHSPIRSVVLSVLMTDLSYYTSVHFARHVHTVHYVSTSRPDIVRHERSVDDRVNHKMVLNAQALIDMMRKRLCMRCAPDTRKIAENIKELMMGGADQDIQILGEVLVPNCVYRGGCPEFKSCGRAQSQDVSILSLVERYSEYNDRFNEGGISC